MGGQPKEIILMPDGEVTNLRLDHEFEYGNGFILPQQWSEMIRVAERLSEPFKYVRVDLYLAEGKVKFGEMTFYPKNGNYRGTGQKVLGKIVDFDRATKLPQYSK